MNIRLTATGKWTRQGQSHGQRLKWSRSQRWADGAERTSCGRLNIRGSATLPTPTGEPHLRCTSSRSESHGEGGQAHGTKRPLPPAGGWGTVERGGCGVRSQPTPVEVPRFHLSCSLLDHQESDIGEQGTLILCYGTFPGALWLAQASLAHCCGRLTAGQPIAHRNQEPGRGTTLSPYPVDVLTNKHQVGKILPSGTENMAYPISCTRPWSGFMDDPP